MMVDNLGKNMMLDTWDNKIFYPRFYDCDTICSYDNSGQLKFGVDIEMAQGYWNTSSSRLWTRVRDLFHDELVETYNTMRKNGMSYETFMECFYDEQIAKIPQKYYNMDFDVKYAPFADSYLGMANGDVYEHVKRWLKQRLRFVDTMYDYAPSYNNDMLTIRANTTELMTLEIETYTPVYQHLSWYNNQMDKKKIDGKTSVTFTGRAMAATDQEVLIYGGSNIKSIKGISSMNPNRMLIGSATKLVKLEAPNCPLLADVNANKANFAPHAYLNKLDISNCPMLGGNLIVNNSPLLREIDIRGTAITGLNLPANLKNLEILRMPAAIKSFILNDATQLHTLEFEDGVVLESINMRNCYSLRNTVNFDIRTVSSLILDNCLNEYEEFYFSNTNNISLSNMPNLKRLILTPNAEYETFDRTNIDNGKNYKINTFNCTNLKEFITTAPYRDSYNDCEILGEAEIEREIEIEIEIEDKNIVPENMTIANGWLHFQTGEFNLDNNGVTRTCMNYIEVKGGERYVVQGGMVQVIFHDSDKKYIGSAIDVSAFTTPSACKYIRFHAHYTVINSIAIIGAGKTMGTTTITVSVPIKDYPEKRPNQVFVANELDLSNTQFESVKLLCTTDVNSLKLSKYTKDFVIDSAYDLDEYYLSDGGYINIHTDLKQCYQTHHTDEVLLDGETPNIIPSASDGSLIFSIHTSDTEQIQDKVWDLSGMLLDNMQTFGLNNDIIQNENGSITMPNRTDGYNITVANKQYTREITRYTVNTPNVFPIFNPEFKYSYEMSELEGGKYSYSIIADDLNNMPTSMKFRETNLLSVEYIKADIFASMDSMFSGCSNLVSVNTENWNVSNVTNMDSMFSGCSNLVSVNTENWNVSNVTNMANMFYGCQSLTKLDLRTWDVRQVTNMSGLICGCNKLKELYIENWQPNSVKWLSYAFNGCSSLIYADLSVFKSSPLEMLNYTFSGAGFEQSTYEGVKDWDVTRVTSIEGMARGTEKIKSLEPFRNWKTDSLRITMLCWQSCQFTTIEPLKNWNFSKVSSLLYFFHACSKLTDLTGMDEWNITPILTDIGIMFGYVPLSEEVDLSSWAPNVINVNSISETFAYGTVLKKLNISGWKPNKTVNLSRTFFYASAFNELILGDGFINTNNIADAFSATAITTESSFEASKIDTTACTTMYRTFQYCNKVTSLDLSSWNLENFTSLQQAFYGCKELTSVKLHQGSNKITNVDSMFINCTKLTYLEPPMLDKVTSSIFDLSSCPLDVDSAVRVMNNLGTSTSSQVLKFSAITLASLSESQIAIAVNKGWTVE